MVHYQRPSWFTDNVFNRIVAILTGLGISVWGSRVLAVRGRKTGLWRTTPVNLLVVGGNRYLVAPRGHTQWVRNLRESGQGRLLLGRRSEDFRASEVPVEERPALLRPYLRRWKFEIGAFFGGVGPDSADSELLRIAPDHPVFRLEPVAPPGTGPGRLPNLP
jgi:deazaflavin-dependent oxidoreductase (nitroreductase family)